MYGNLCALTATGFWLQFASYMELPVSTTHSISKYRDYNGTITSYGICGSNKGMPVWCSANLLGSASCRGIAGGCLCCFGTMHLLLGELRPHILGSTPNFMLVFF